MRFEQAGHPPVGKRLAAGLAGRALLRGLVGERHRAADAGITLLARANVTALGLRIHPRPSPPASGFLWALAPSVGDLIMARRQLLNPKHLATLADVSSTVTVMGEFTAL